ncbi:DeoR/GlpR family DNA-binding transcription regulator [Alkalicoccus halolimnae]|uniref:Lactose phosphotransferase system repressor n=1 Tax=Alkalicoccus halolimnae TaxID=1667239 RepID=A0A5C7FGC4_9BACI|nr:DeoR/GlpR family DNA-binding transcription regulator [Alkalicoccus halolimnae]TXF85324.1 DeoR/GlpR transcriptional regulator [Alkalicoccus halolimnae]
MLKQERQQKILKILNEEQKVIASDLSQRLSVSEDTIRRDLKELDRKELIKRVHSGALRVGPPVVDFYTRQNVKSDIKMRLANKAMELVKDNMVLLIDGGTTNLNFVNQLPRTYKGTVITNSPPIAMDLSNHNDVEVIMIGGSLFKESMVNLGIETVESLNNMRADLYIMGIHKIDANIGISLPNLAEAAVKRKMAAVSNEVLSMVTADKLNTFSNHIVSPANVLSYLITEDLQPDILQLYKSQQIAVMTV